MRAIKVSLLVLLVAATAAAQSNRRRAIGGPFPIPLLPCSPGMVAFAPGLSDFVLDGRDVYFGDEDGGIWRVPREGGRAPALLTRHESPELLWMHVDATDVYFATSSGTLSADLFAIPKTGGAVPRVVSSAVVTPTAFAADAQAIYWVSAGTYAGEKLRSDGAVRRVAKGGGAVQTLASGLSFPIAVAPSGGDVYFSEAGLADGNASAGLRRVPAGGGTVVKLLDGAPVGSIAIDGADAYLAIFKLELGQVDIGRVPLAGGSVTLLEAGVDFVKGLAIQGGSLFYGAEANDQTYIAAIDLASGRPRLVETVDLLLPRLAFDECLVYYASALQTIARTDARASARRRTLSPHR